MPQEVQGVTLGNKLRRKNTEVAAQECSPSDTHWAAGGNTKPLVHGSVYLLVGEVADRGVVEQSILSHRAKDLDARLEVEAVGGPGGEEGKQGADDTLKGGGVKGLTGRAGVGGVHTAAEVLEGPDPLKSSAVEVDFR